MSKTIWLLTSGQYSDYSVHAAYLTEEEAHAACDQMNSALDDYEKCGVETVPLSPELPAFKDGYGWWDVNLNNGEWSARIHNSVYQIKEDAGVRKWGPTGKPPIYGVTLVADSEERALKAGMERIMQFKASELIPA